VPSPRPPTDQDFPARHHAAMPPARMAQIPWLLVDGVLITPFPVRASGPTAGETDAIRAMQRRLKRSRVAVWINPHDGRLTSEEIATDVLAAKAAARNQNRSISFFALINLPRVV
jgi:hypothetical protein